MTGFPHFFGLGSPRLCAGLDIATDRVRLALLLRSGRRAQLLKLTQRLTGGVICRDGQITDFEALTLICRSLLDEPGCQGAALALAVPVQGLTGRRLVLPAGSHPVQRWRQVQSELAAHGIGADDHAMDYRELGPPPGSPSDQQVLAVAASRLIIEDRLSLAAAVGRPLVTLAPEDLCLAAWLREDRLAGETAVLRLDRSARWLLHGDGPSHALPEVSARGGHLALLAHAAPLLKPLPRRLLLTGDHPALGTIARAFVKYGGLEARVRVQYQAALTQQAQLPALQSRQRTLAVQLAAQQGQLWPADQLQPELLQAKLARRASECGLTLSSFKPLSGRLAAAIVLRGSHSGLLRFVELVASLPLPVMFERLDVNVVEKDGQSELQMNASVSAPVTASLSGIETKETPP